MPSIRNTWRKCRKTRKQILPFVIGSMVVLIPLFLFSLKNKEQALAMPWAASMDKWTMRRQLTLVNNSGQTFEANTTYSVSINTKELFGRNQIQSNCNDIRVIYQPDGSTATELSRYTSVANGAASCNDSTSTTIYFPLQANISNSATDSSYFIYYGNKSAPAPTTPENAFNIGSKVATLVCPFNGSTTCSAGETPSTATGAIRYTQGKSALSFDGNNDYLQVTGNLGISGTDYTIEGWFNSMNEGSNGSNSRLVYSADIDIYSHLSIENNGCLYIANSTAYNTFYDGNTHHLAIVYLYASDRYQIYLDGTEVTYTTQTTCTSKAALSTNFSIMNNPASLNRPTRGVVDELRVSNIARYTDNFTPATGRLIRDTSTKLLLHFDESGDDPRNSGKAIDDSGNGNNGTITGAKYVDGLIGVERNSSDTGTESNQSYASHGGVLLEEGTRNLILNPSFENSTYNTNWSSSGTITLTKNTSIPYYKFGSASAKAVASGGDGNITTTITPPDNTTHVLSAYVYDGTAGSAGGTVSSSVASIYFNGAAATTTYTDSGGGWWRLSSVLSMPPSETYASSNVDANQALYTTATNRRLSQGFKVPYNQTASMIGVYLTGVGEQYGRTNPYVMPEIQTDSGGLPSGTPVTNGIGDCTYTADSVSTTPAMITLGFTTPPSLTTGTQYHLVLKTYTSSGCDTESATPDNTNYITWGYDNSSSSYSNGDRATYNGSWNTQSGQDHSFEIYQDNIAYNFGVLVKDTKTVYIDGLQLENGDYNYTGQEIQGLWKDYATTYTDGSLGTGYAWTGTTNNSTSTRGVSNITYDSSNISSSSGTISLWIKPLYFHPSSIGWWYSDGFFGTMDSSGDMNDAMYIYRDANGNIFCGMRSTTVTLGTITENAWNNVIMTWNGTNFSCYTNGTSSGSNNYTGTPTIDSIVLGGTQNWGAGGYMKSNAMYSDLRVYNDALTSAEASDLYLSGLGSHQLASTQERWNDQPTVLNWQFDEGYGTTAQDSTINNNTGTITNAVYSADSPYTSNSLYFDGTGYYVSRTYNGDTELDPASDSFSTAMWFRHTTSPPVSGTHTLLARYSSGGYKVYMNTSGYICFGVDDDGTWGPDFSACSTTSFADNKWHFVQAVKNGVTTDITLYIDGLQVAQTTTLTGLTNLSGSSPTLYVGVDSDGSSNYWNGFIDDVKIYGKTRSTTDVKTDYNAARNIRGTSASFGDINPNNSLSNGLVGYWKMDEYSWNGTPNEVVDASGNSNTATATGNATTSTTSKFSRAGTFDGTGDMLISGYNASLNTPDALTLSAWIKTASVGRADIIQRYYGDTPFNGYALILAPNYNGNCATDGFVGFWVGDMTNGYVCSNSAVNDNAWHYIVATYNGTTGKIFIDGKLDATSIRSNGLNLNAFPIAIGAENGNFYNFTGQLDEMRIYNRAITDAEVQSLYNFAPGPVIQYKFDENTGTTPKDSSGNSIDITTFQTHGSYPQWTAGKYGSALSFSGSDCVGCEVLYTNDPGTNSLMDVTNFTAESWFYLKQAGDGIPQLLFSKGAGYWPEQNQTFACWAETGWSGPSCYIGDGISYQTIGSISSVSTNSWHHLAFTADGSNIKMYIDGVLYDQDPQTLTPFANNDMLQIGGEYRGVVNMNGYVDEFKLYNYARNQKQITEDMNGGHPAPGSPIGSAIAHWSFDEGYGDTTYDTTGNFNGNLGGADTCPGGTTCPTWTTSGKFGNALTFVAPLHQVTSNLVSASTDNIAVSMWVKWDGTSTNPQILFSNGDDEACNGWGVRLDKTNSDRIEILMSCMDQAYTTATLTQGTWQHLVAQRNNGTWEIYLDGKKLTVNGAITTAPNTPTSRTTIGRFVSNSVGFNGSIDEVKFYNFALTQSEILADMNMSSASAMGGVADHTNEGFAGNPPVAEWKMDEGTWSNDCSTDTVMDTSGNDHNGKSCPIGLGPTIAQTGHIGKSMLFNGIDNYVQIPDNSALEGFSAMSICAWVKPRSTPGGGSVETITAKAASGKIYPHQIWGLFTYLSNNVYYTISDGDSGTRSTLVTTNSLTLNKWQHVCGTYDGNTMRVYIDSKQDPTTTSRSTTLGSNSLDIFIGAWGDNNIGSYDNFWDGWLDEVRLYNYALSQAQIDYIYNRGQPIVSYDFDECTGATIHNSTVNGNKEQISAYNSTYNLGSNGQTSMGTCTASANTPWYNGRVGKYSASVNMDGIDDYIALPTDTELDLTTYSPSIALWFKTSASFPSGTALYNDYGVGGVIATSISIDSDGHLNADYRDSGSNKIDNFGTAVVNNGSWHQAVFVKTGATTTSLYLDGKLETSGSNASFNNETFVGGALPAIGRNTLYDTAYFEGQLDGFKIYNYPLTADMVKKIFNEGAAVRFGN